MINRVIFIKNTKFHGNNRCSYSSENDYLVENASIMATINVYEQYFKAEGNFNGVERKAANVLLISDSEAGHIRYEVAVSFFPHRTDDDFAISYDAYFSKILFEGAGRRSRKREEGLLKSIQEEADELAAGNGAAIFWDKPLIEPRRG